MNKNILQFKQYLLEGYNIKEAAKLSNIKYGSTYSYIKKYNLEVINKGVRLKSDGTYFKEIDTENKAYILGFFIADGYLEKNSKRICFNNSIKDISIINLIQKEICPFSKIIYSNKQKGVIFRNKQITLRFTNSNLYKILQTKYNLYNAKTFNENYKFNLDLIPEHLLHHFIRGYFDGDGCVSFIKKSENKQLYFNFSFVFNSESFAKQIANIFENKFNIKGIIYKHQGKTCNYYSLRFNYYRKRQNKIKEIYTWLYKDANAFLERKNEKFKEYLNTELIN